MTPSDSFLDDIRRAAVEGLLDAEEQADRQASDKAIDYVEGRMTAEQRRDFEANELRSPDVQALVEMLSTPAADAERVVTPSSSATLRSGLSIALAAALLVACGVAAYFGVSASRMSGRMAKLEEKREAELARLADAEASRLARFSAEQGPTFAITDPDRSLALSLLASLDAAARETDTPEELNEEIEQTLQRGLDAADAATGLVEASRDAAARREARLRRVGLLLAAGRLDEADRLLDAIPEAESDAQVINARAALLARRAWEADDIDEADSLSDEAAKLFREAGDAGLARAWLNLVVLERGVRGDFGAARRAASRFVAASEDPAAAQLVRERFGLVAPGDDSE